MIMKDSKSVVGCVSGAWLVAFFCVQAAGASVETLADWSFSRDGKTWESVTVPHDWAIRGPFDPENDKQVTAIAQDGEIRESVKIGRTGALPWPGTGEYRRTITLPANVGWASLIHGGSVPNDTGTQYIIGGLVKVDPSVRRFWRPVAGRQIALLAGKNSIIYSKIEERK